MSHQREILGSKNQLEAWASKSDIEDMSVLWWPTHFSEDLLRITLFAHKHTPLAFTCKYGLVEMFTELLASSKDVPPIAFVLAVWYGHTKIVQLLLAREDLNLEIQDNVILRSLDVAIFRGHVKILEALLEQKYFNVNGAFDVSTYETPDSPPSGTIPICSCAANTTTRVNR